MSFDKDDKQLNEESEEQEQKQESLEVNDTVSEDISEDMSEESLVADNEDETGEELIEELPENTKDSKHKKTNIADWFNGTKFREFKAKTISGKLYTCLYYVCIVAFIVCVYLLLQRGYELYVNTKTYEELPRPTRVSLRTPSPSTELPTDTMKPSDATAYYDPERTLRPGIYTPKPGTTTNPYEDESTPTPVPVIREKFADLLAINQDVVGYIQIGDLIDYPVLQGTDNSKYLEEDIYGKKTKYGSIFMDYSCESVDLMRNTILHGHHMKDGSMFRYIELYKRKYMWDDYPIVYFDTLYEDMEWEVFSVYVVNAYEASIQLTFESDQAFIDYCYELQDKSIYNKNLEFGPNDKILTMSTCSYEFEDARTLVHARLVNRSGEMWNENYDWYCGPSPTPAP